LTRNPQTSDAAVTDPSIQIRRHPHAPARADPRTAVHDESFAGVTYHIRGELVPELQIEITDQSVMFEHHVLLWKETQLNIELKKLPGAIKRKIAGLEFFVTKTAGSGRIAFSRDSPGQCIPLHLKQGEGLDVREHQFIAATDNLDYSFERIKGVQNMLLGGSGFFMDKFRATDGDALVWLHGHGNVFLVTPDGRRADRRRGRRVALQGPHGQARGGHAWASRPASSVAAASSPGTASLAPAAWRSRRCSSRRWREWRAPPRQPAPAASRAR
jgi:uncharacterized protein (AIM24 family)